MASLLLQPAGVSLSATNSCKTAWSRENLPRRLSGAFMMSSRRQSLVAGEPPGALPPASPFHLSPFRESEEEQEISELELNDEEFVAQEQAHT